MDLGAFLRPGGLYSVLMAAANETAGGAAPVRGWLAARRDKPSWAAPGPQPPGRVLTVTLELDGFRLTRDGDLAPDVAGAAVVKLLAQVKGCRPLSPAGPYILRLRLLGRATM
ncbi:MAG: hypothetical protein LBS31_11435 [Candidatus Adiutrix sp.]|jgi:hypothetical protein|nr:hypothetical protein [Candidatus Adiutrix sp.]